MTDEERLEKQYQEVMKLFAGKAVLAATAVTRIEKEYRGPKSIIALSDIVKILNIAIKKGDVKVDYYYDQKDNVTPHVYFQFKEKKAKKS